MEAVNEARTYFDIIPEARSVPDSEAAVGVESVVSRPPMVGSGRNIRRQIDGID